MFGGAAFGSIPFAGSSSTIVTTARSTPSKFALSGISTRVVPTRMALSATPTRTIPTSLALSQILTRTGTTTRISVSGVSSRSAVTSMRLSALLSRQTPVTMPLSGLRRASIARIALAGVASRSSVARIAVQKTGIARTVTGVTMPLAGVQVTRTAPASIALTMSRSRSAITRMALAAMPAGPSALVNYGNLSVHIDTSQVRTDVVAGGGVSLANTTDTFTADGVTFFWRLTKAVAQTSGNAQLPTLTANGTPKVLGQANAGGGGAPNTPYVLVSFAPGISALMLGTDAVPNPGTVLVISYPYDVPVAARVQDTRAIQAAQLSGVPNRGQFSSKGSIGNAGLTLQAALAQALSQLTAYSTPYLKVSLTLPESYTGTGLEPGQQITFQSGNLSITRSMVITQVEWDGSPMRTGKRVHLTLEA